MMLALVLAVAAQAAPPRDTRPAAPAGRAAIRGRIVAGDTGRPLVRARITLSAPELPDGERTTSTNREGRYEIGNLPAGHYSMSVTRAGYLTLRYGQRRPLEPGRTLDILGNQRVDNLDMALPRMSLITGRITDEAGDPIAGATVTALRPVYVDGVRQFAPDTSASGATDGDGEYRLTGLAPGTYAVLATFNDTWTVTTTGTELQMSYAPTYFPGATTVASANRVTLGIGQEARNTDFALVTGRTATVSGTAFDSHGRPLQNVVVFQVSAGGSAGIRTFGGPGAVRVADDGGFSIRRVPPGDYQLVASGHDESAIIPITVDGADIGGLAAVGTAGWSVTGRILTEDGHVPQIAQRFVRVSAEMPGLFSSLQGLPAYTQRLNADWTFAVTGITGAARLRANMPAGWMLKAAVRDGTDISDMPLEAESGRTLSRVQIVITNQLARVSGQVTDDRGASAVDGTIVLFPADATKWYENSRHVRAVRANQTGRFEVAGLLPGEYLAVAVDYVEQGQWNDPSYLESLRGHAIPVTLAADRPVDVALPLTAAP